MGLEKKLDNLTGQFHEKQAQLSEVLQAAKLDPAVVASVTKKLEQVLGSKTVSSRTSNIRCTNVQNATTTLFVSTSPSYLSMAFQERRSVSNLSKLLLR